jgi:hypothetical protein
LRATSSPSRPKTFICDAVVSSGVATVLTVVLNSSHRSSLMSLGTPNSSQMTRMGSSRENDVWRSTRLPAGVAAMASRNSAAIASTWERRASVRRAVNAPATSRRSLACLPPSVKNMFCADTQ